MQQVQGSLDEVPAKSLRAFAKDINVTEFTIRRIVHEDIRYMFWVIRRDQFISVQTR